MIKTTLMEAIKSEKNVKTYQKLIAVNMVRGKGCSTSFAAETVGVTQRSVQLWLEQFDNGGIKGLGLCLKKAGLHLYCASESRKLQAGCVIKECLHQKSFRERSTINTESNTACATFEKS